MTLHGCCDCSLYPRLCWVSFISCVVGVIPFMSSSWTDGHYGNYESLQTGLLLFCHHDRIQSNSQSMCAPLLFGQDQVWFETVLMLSMLSWIFVFTVFVMSLLLYFLDSAHTFSLPLTIMGLLSGVLGIVGAFVYAISWTRQRFIPYYDVTLSWGFVVYVIWHVMTLSGFIFICILGRDDWRNQFKLKRRH